jgi:glucuronate isomerase
MVCSCSQLRLYNRNDRRQSYLASTITISQHSVATSRLELLPSELLERILLKTLRGAQSLSAEKKHLFDLRCFQDMNSCCSKAASLLGHRLVCSTIRDHSWRALAKVVGETVCDLCSRQSMGHFMALSRSKALAPWVRKLTVTYCYVEGPRLSEEHLAIVKHTKLDEAHLLKKIDSIVQDHLAWFRGVAVFDRTLQQQCTDIPRYHHQKSTLAASGVVSEGFAQRSQCSLLPQASRGQVHATYSRTAVN